MNIIINTSTLSASGATQVATSFITECRKFSENSYHVFLSETVAKQISVKDFPDNFSFYTFEGHPLYGAKGFRVRKQLQKLEAQILPDVVFSVFGPSWWKPKAPHVQGYAYPYYVYPESPIVDKLTFKEKYVQQQLLRFFEAAETRKPKYSPYKKARRISIFIVMYLSLA